MFERYTDRARRVLFFARHEAQQLGASEIHPEHLLLGIIKGGQGLTSRFLALHHVSLEELRREVERRITRGVARPETAELPFSPAARRALDEAAHAVDRAARTAIEADDLLIGISRAGDRVAAATLESMGLAPATIEEGIRRILEESDAAAEALAVSLEAAVADPHHEFARLRGEVAELRARVERLERQQARRTERP